MSLAWQDYATEDRQARLWRMQHSTLVGIVQCGFALALAVVGWVALAGMARWAWTLTHFKLGR
jgi:hypothetical protein